MTITFVSAFLNHHQILLCEELRKHCNEFYYISTMPVPQERIDFGYEDIEKKHSYVIRAYDGSTDPKEIEAILLRSDAVIFGECDNKYIELRMKENKLSFLYSERFFKKGTWRRFIPQTRKKIENRVIQYKNKNLYVLCASAFLSYDLSLLGFDVQKCFKWGYFPQVKSYDTRPERNNNPIKLLWVGRFLPLKHTEDAIYAASKLKDSGIDFTFDIIGTGECEEPLKETVRKLHLEKQVNFLGSMSPSSVIENMEKADIFMMTSDFHEGWGAVVNEAMSTGCAVLLSSALGCANFLLKDKENGLVYEYGNQMDFASKLYLLATNKKLTEDLGTNAFKTIKEEYNQKIAVERLMEFIKNDCRENKDYTEGPMSKAPKVKNKWYKV
ncbi:MAG: glycosyltransferase [Ruminococcaceae bacterium]|nr:glycosyltransferase [Oscillospiraceae bacterium]